MVNRYLKRAGLPDRIDHRSFEDQGITATPTIHEGVVARALEAKGILSDRCEINRIIKADNKKMVAENVSETDLLAEQMEDIRDKLIVLQYQIADNDAQRRIIEAFLFRIEPDMEMYHARQNELNVLKTKKKSLQEQLKNLPGIHPVQSLKLKQQIAEVTEEMEDVIGNRSMILTKLQCRNTKDADALERKTKTAHDTRNAILARQPKLYEQFDQHFEEYHQTLERALTDAISAIDTIRSEHQQKVRTKLEKIYGERFDSQLYKKCVHEVDAMLSNPHHSEHDRVNESNQRAASPNHQKQQDEER